MGCKGQIKKNLLIRKQTCLFLVKYIYLRIMKRKSIRDIIVATSARLFYKYGYSNTGINQIIEEAKIAKSSLYQHFRSKEEVLIAYLELTGEQTVAALKGAAAQYESPLDKLVGIFDYLESL